MWRQPKRNTRNACGHRGQCSCQRRINATITAHPEDAPHPCTNVCQPGKGTCGGTVRGGKCPCPYC